MRVLVCGSRAWPTKKMVHVVLDGLLAQYPDLEVISGMASGADRHAAEWAERHGCLIAFPADWGTHGRAAGPIRNRQMLDAGRPDLVVAFSDNIATSVGTKDMATIAAQAGIPVYVIGRFSD